MTVRPAKALEHRVEHGALLVRVERADRVVGDQDVRLLEDGARQRQLLSLGERQAGAGDAGRRLQPRLDDARPQVEILEDLADQVADPLGRLGLAVGDLAEQDVVLQAGADGVVLGAEERRSRAARSSGSCSRNRRRASRIARSAGRRRPGPSRWRAGISLKVGEIRRLAVARAQRRRACSRRLRPISMPDSAADRRSR